jgi:hypothetical protein
MSFSSVDYLISRITSGFTYTAQFHHFRGLSSKFNQRTYDLSNTVSTGTPNAWSGTSLAWTPCNESTGNGTQVFGIPHGGNTSPDTKHITNVFFNNPTIQGEYILVDLQGYWPGISTTTTSAQNLTGTPGSNLRYANGAGCRLYMVVTNTLGATTANVTISYTNQAGTTGRANPVTIQLRSDSPNTQIAHAASSNNNFPLFLPLQVGDIGVANVASVTISPSMLGSGTVALCLARPILTITNPLAEMTHRNFATSIPALPEIKDGACLIWIYRSISGGDVLNGCTGTIDFVW